MEESRPTQISQQEITRRLRALNDAEQALAQARTQENKEHLVACFNWFVKRGITLRIIDDRFVLSPDQSAQP
jgi:hypothetical protein